MIAIASQRKRLVMKAVIIALLVLLLPACATDSSIRYPTFLALGVAERAKDCESLDQYLRQVDAVRWSMREDGVELESRFAQVVQTTLATASAIALVPVVAYSYDPTILALPYAATYTNADRLKHADALIIALFAQQGRSCLPASPGVHNRCR